MAARRPAPVFSENFINNLETVRAFLSPNSSLFERLLDRLFEDIVPNICRFPQIGHPLLRHPIRSKETHVLLRKLKKLVKKEESPRELLIDDYIVLYLCRNNTIVFLSIKHHRQLSFDLRRFWTTDG